MPTWVKRERAWAVASLPSMSVWRRNGSEICLPIRMTGLSEVIGSWKTMEIWEPHSWRRDLAGALRISWPMNRTEPVRTTPSRGTSPMIERESTVLPDPDSPTMPTVSPRSRVRETPLTALSAPAAVEKVVWRSSTSSRVVSVPASGKVWSPGWMVGLTAGRR